ncbi:hypothetical protein [Actinomadura fibrosa]
MEPGRPLYVVGTTVESPPRSSRRAVRRGSRRAPWR